MYLELGLASICLSGFGVYACTTLKKEDIEDCFKRADEQLDKFGEKLFELVSITGNHIEDFIEKMKNEVDNDESKQGEITKLLEVKVDEESVELITLEKRTIILTPSPVSSDSERTLEEFILLNQTSGDESK